MRKREREREREREKEKKMAPVRNERLPFKMLCPFLLTLRPFPSFDRENLKHFLCGKRNVHLFIRSFSFRFFSILKISIVLLVVVGVMSFVSV